jgi:hypothetical protein
VVRVGAWSLDPAHRTLRAAALAFGSPTDPAQPSAVPGCMPVSVPGGTGYIEAEWPAVGLSAEFHASGTVLPTGKVCGFPGNARLVNFSRHDNRRQLTSGLRVGMPATSIARYAPGATRHTASWGTWWDLWYAWAFYGSFDGRAASLAATVEHGRITEFTAALFEHDRYQRYAAAIHRESGTRFIHTP